MELQIVATEYYAGVEKVKVNLNVGAWKVPQDLLLSKKSLSSVAQYIKYYPIS